MSTLLTCTDGSLDAASIYPHASWAALRLAASIHLLHVIERDESREPRDLTGSIGFEAKAELLEDIAKGHLGRNLERVIRTCHVPMMLFR